MELNDDLIFDESMKNKRINMTNLLYKYIKNSAVQHEIAHKLPSDEILKSYASRLETCSYNTAKKEFEITSVLNRHELIIFSYSKYMARLFYNLDPKVSSVYFTNLILDNKIDLDKHTEPSSVNFDLIKNEKILKQINLQTSQKVEDQKVSTMRTCRICKFNGVYVDIFQKNRADEASSCRMRCAKCGYEWIE